MSFRTALTAAVFTVTLACAAPFALAQDDPVVAKFKGGEVRLSEVQRLFLSQPQLSKMPIQMVFPQLVDSVVANKLALTTAEKAGLRKDADFKKALAAAEKDLLIQLYVSREIDKILTDDKLKAEYDKMVASLPQKDEVHARHILLETEDDAKTVIGILAKGGDFATLAKERSTGPSAEKGGDLGYFREGQMVKEFSDAAFGMKVGEVSKTPVKSNFGWHVIKVEDRRPIEPPPFDAVKVDIARQMEGAVASDVLAKLMDGVAVERFNPDGSPITAPTTAPTTAQ